MDVKRRDKVFYGQESPDETLLSQFEGSINNYLKSFLITENYNSENKCLQ